MISLSYVPQQYSLYFSVIYMTTVYFSALKSLNPQQVSIHS